MHSRDMHRGEGMIEAVGFLIIFVWFPWMMLRLWHRTAINYRKSYQPYAVHRPYATGE